MQFQSNFDLIRVFESLVVNCNTFNQRIEYMQSSKKQVESCKFRILISSDNHLGYKERDIYHGQDSFNAFEEVLEVANQQQTDFVLLGGDLFHELRPTSETYYKTSKILNEQVFGPPPSKAHQKLIPMPILNEPQNKVDFETLNYPGANYLSEAHRVRMPIFSIHGNHDHPVGLEMHGCMDQLSVNNYINYFGKVTDIENIVVDPVIFVKGQTKIALYGIGNVKDTRLNLSLQNGKVKFNRPAVEGTDDPWFSILVVHQNRYKGAQWQAKESISDEMIPAFFDLVVWGHEHESIPRLQQVSHTEVQILQPGSTVPTSLIEAEAKPKHCFVLEVTKDNFTLQEIPLKKARPFLFRHIELKSSGVPPNAPALLEQWLVKNTDMLLKQHDKDFAASLTTEMMANLSAYPSMPLVRLKIDFSGGYSPVNIQRFSQQFKDRIANYQTFLQFFKSKSSVEEKSHKKPSTKSDQDEFKLEEPRQQVELQSYVEQAINQRQLAGEAKALDIPSHIFLKILDSQGSTPGESFERFFDENIYRATYNELSKEMYKSLQDQELDMDEIFSKKEEGFAELQKQISEKSQQIYLQNGLLLEEEITKLREQRKQRAEKADLKAQTSEESDEFDKVFNKANSQNSLDVEEIKKEPKPKGKSRKMVQNKKQKQEPILTKKSASPMQRKKPTYTQMKAKKIQASQMSRVQQIESDAESSLSEIEPNLNMLDESSQPSKPVRGTSRATGRVPAFLREPEDNRKSARKKQKVQ